jgi:hypothetical protein
MRQVYHPLTVRRHGDVTALTVKMRDLAEHACVGQLLMKRFGEFTWYPNIRKSRVLIVHQDNRCNIYQYAESCGIVTVHILRLYDDTRVDGDVRIILSHLKEANQEVADFATVTVLLFVPWSFNMNVSSLLARFANQGERATDAYQTGFASRTKLYTLQAALREV